MKYTLKQLEIQKRRLEKRYSQIEEKIEKLKKPAPIGFKYKNRNI